MSKAVLISIRPKWCEKIASGEKTIEVRKTRPKLETPFKCYIYCTKAKERLIGILKDGDENYGESYNGKPVFIKTYKSSDCYAIGHSSAVIGDFVCDEIIEIDSARKIQSDVARPTCLEPAELHKYLGVAVGYGWHISNLKLYDEPKKLSEFTELRKTKFGMEPVTITRPPQSWGYVEELP